MLQVLVANSATTIIRAEAIEGEQNKSVAKLSLAPPARNRQCAKKAAFKSRKPGWIQAVISALRRADWMDRVQRFINTSKGFRRFSGFKEHAPVGNQQSANHNGATSKRPKARIFRNHCPDQQRGQDRFK